MNPNYHSFNNVKDLSFLVTGGAGFIGSHIVDYLVNNQARRVVVVDNLSTGSIENIKHHIGKEGFVFLQEDLCDFNNCVKACENIDIVFHQAAVGSVPRSIEFPLVTNENNVSAHLNILWAAEKQNVKRVIYASSSSVYGDNNDIPKVEAQIGMPLSPYAVSKRVNELYSHVFSNLYKLQIIGLRYFNVFGPRQNPNGPYAAVIPIFINSILQNQSPVIHGSGEQSRDFTFVENIVQANIKAAFTQSTSACGDIFNIGAGGNTSVNKLFDIISTQMKKDIKPVKLPERKGDVLKSSASIRKAMEVLGYEPIVFIEEGVEKTIKYFQSI